MTWHDCTEKLPSKRWGPRKACLLFRIFPSLFSRSPLFIPKLLHKVNSTNSEEPQALDFGFPMPHVLPFPVHFIQLPSLYFHTLVSLLPHTHADVHTVPSEPFPSSFQHKQQFYLDSHAHTLPPAWLPWLSSHTSLKAQLKCHHPLEAIPDHWAGLPFLCSVTNVFGKPLCSPHGEHAHYVLVSDEAFWTASEAMWLAHENIQSPFVGNSHLQCQQQWCWQSMVPKVSPSPEYITLEGSTSRCPRGGKFAFPYSCLPWGKLSSLTLWHKSWKLGHQCHLPQRVWTFLFWI